ncbi:hypothetical protein DY000_02041721 [Brassica cretica]|uniref:Uncharacterized protein n=1 Tax=Brassica cretica TaxID=69181 RepID=A0ABQ7BIM4_BRACR|nr:hypothetical protein DY000_02041721 [Brassica cretica]
MESLSTTIYMEVDGYLCMGKLIGLVQREKTRILLYSYSVLISQERDLDV